MEILSRRNFLKRSFGTLAVSALLPASAQVTRSSRPNILWLSCEDISSHLGCFGEKHAITPNIDEIVAEGIRYTNAYTVHGVCAPSRSGIIMGMYPSSIGSVNMRCQASKPDSIKCFTEYLREAGYYCSNNSKEDYNFQTPKTAWDESGAKAHWNKRPEGKPFFAVFNFFDSHESKLWNSADFDKTHPERLKESEWQKPENMTVPPIYPDTPQVRRDFARLFERITEFDYFVKDRIDELKRAGLYEDTIIFIWSDHGDGLPRAKRWLYDSGTRVPLIVRIPEAYRTNGQAKPNSADDQLVNFIDLGPTVLNLTNVPIPEYMQGRPFLGPNLPRKRKYIFGARQRIDELYDMVRSVRDDRYRYVRNFMPFVPYLPYLDYAERCNTMKAMRKLYAEGKLNDVQAQWMAPYRPAEELYDLEKDPWETRSLIGKADYADVQKRLRKALEDWMTDTRDTGLIPEPEMIRLAEQYGSEYYIFRQEDGKPRVEKLLKLATIASQPKESDRSVIDEAFQSPDPAARYWAVLARRTNTGQTDKLLTAAQDENACVRIAAAWSLCLLGKQKQAVSVLEKEIKQVEQQDEILHFAMNVLNQCGPAAQSAIKTVKTLQQASGKSKYIERICETFIKQFNQQK